MFLWLHVCVYVLAIYCANVCVSAQLTELKKLSVVMMLLQEKAVWMVTPLIVEMMMTVVAMITGTVMAANFDSSSFYQNTSVSTAVSINNVHARVYAECMSEYFPALFFASERNMQIENRHY